MSKNFFSPEIENLINEVDKRQRYRSECKISEKIGKKNNLREVVVVHD